MKRRKTQTVRVGNVPIGGDHPIVVQSMCNTKTQDVSATVAQIHQLVTAGCELVRIAIKDNADIPAFKRIKQQSPIPVIADVHFDRRLAMSAIDAGADKIRINPGNTPDFFDVIAHTKANHIPVRIGFNSGSSNGFDFSLLDKLNYDQVILAAKHTDVGETIAAYRKLSEMTNLPLHIGVTESGTLWSGSIKSAVGIGTLLAEGIGDTVRVSLAGDPVKEVEVAYKILQSLGLRQYGVEVIACPTCGRTEIDVEALATAVENATQHIRKPLKIAVMGCIVNGPGEAKHADFGICGGKGEGLIFAQGEPVKKVKETNLVDELLAIILK